MADERLLAGIRRFWTPAQVTTAYETILNAYQARLSDVTVIVGKSAEGDSAQAQVVVRGEDYLAWMDVLEARLRELKATADGTTGPGAGFPSLDFSRRIISP